jgi:hypothetical protein
MTHKMLRSLTLAMSLAATVAHAQSETLTYSGGPITGTVDVTDYPGDYPGNMPASFTQSLDGGLTGSFTLSSPLPLNGTTTVSPIGYFVTPLSGTIGDMYAEGNPFTFTTKDGAIVGWNIEIDECPCYGSQVLSSSNTGGDSYTVNTDLAPDSDGLGFTFSGSASGPSGSWTAVTAPEIDPASAASGLALVIGGLVVVRGRKRQGG